jgi:hypothetical protein
MSKEQILFVSVIAIMLGVCVAVFFFYLKPKLEKYQIDERTAQQLEETLKQFDNEFEGVRPSDLISEIQRRTQPWMDARLEWGKPFNVADWLVRAQPRPEEQYPRFYYDEESKRLLEGLRDTIRAKQPNLYYPQSLRADLGVASLEDWNNIAVVTDEMVNRELSKLSFGIALYEMLIQYNPYQIFDVEIWPPRTEQVTGKVVTFYTAGIHLQILLKDLVKLLEQFRLENRYFNVDGLRIRWETPWYEPYLTVEMLVSQAVWQSPDARDASLRMPGGGPGGAAGPAGMAGAGGVNDRLAALQAAAAQRATERESERQASEPGPVGRVWRWIKRNIFYISG